MISSMMSRFCLVTLVAWWGFMFLHTPWSAAQLQEVNTPTDAKPEGGVTAREGDEEKKSAAELIGLKEKVEALAQAFEAKKTELTPRIREMQLNAQQAAAALQRAIGPDESKALEEELRAAQEALSLLEQELAMAEEEVRVAEGMLTVAEKRAMQRRAKEQASEADKALTAQEARVATEEAEVAAEKVSLAEGKVASLQAELRALEKEAAENVSARHHHRARDRGRH